MPTVGKPSEFRISLNPRNPEANSWYDPGTNTNLFLSRPQSDDLSGFSPAELEPVARGIRAGLLVVSRGDIPTGLSLTPLKAFAAPRIRWTSEDPNKQDAMDAQAKSAMMNHERVTKLHENTKAEKIAEKTESTKTDK